MRRILGILIKMIPSETTAVSQQMPITVTPILTPPYTTSLSKMSESGSTSLMVNIYVGDVTITEVPVRLRIKMESHGITITSRKDTPVIPLFRFGLKATSRIKTFVFKFISVPAKWVRTSRQYVLNIYSCNNAYADVFQNDFG